MIGKSLLSFFDSEPGANYSAALDAAMTLCSRRWRHRRGASERGSLDFFTMRRVSQSKALFLALSLIMGGRAQSEQTNLAVSQKLRTITIANEKVEGSPKEIVARLNELAKKYDTPTHKGVRIRFDPAVDSQCCSLSIFRQGEPLINWLQDVCAACGSRYRVEDSQVLIELLPISGKRTANVEGNLTSGMAQICQDFRSQRGKDRYALGEKLFRLLPHSLVTSEKDIGTGTIVTYDSDRPSYKLYKRDIMQLLGEPDRNVNNEHFYYSLRPGGSMIWELGVDFGEHEYVENPSFTGYSRK